MGFSVMPVTSCVIGVIGVALAPSDHFGAAALY